VDVGLLLLHGFLGAALAAHALQKLFAFRLDGTAAYLASLGFRRPRPMTFAVIGTELVGGLLLAFGLLLPLGAVLVAATMLVAARTDHRGKGWFISGAGAEYAITNAVVALALTAAGGGRYSLDRVLGLDLSGTSWLIAAALLATAGAALVLSPAFRALVGRLDAEEVSPVRG
jgi:putative oxidoreductase